MLIKHQSVKSKAIKKCFYIDMFEQNIYKWGGGVLFKDDPKVEALFHFKVHESQTSFLKLLFFYRGT